MAKVMLESCKSITGTCFEANQYLTVSHYSPNTVRNYLSELRYLFGYYCNVSRQGIIKEQIPEYVVYLTTTLGAAG